MLVKAATYNILAQESIPKCDLVVSDSVYLDYDYRFNRILIRLRYLMAGGYVICLQEVTNRFFTDISPHLVNYGMILGLTKDDEFSGSAVLYPVEQYELAKARTFELSPYSERCGLSVVLRNIKHNRVFGVISVRVPVSTTARGERAALRACDAIKKEVDTLSGPCIVGGDINCNRSSVVFRDLIDGLLHNTRPGYTHPTVHVQHSHRVFKSTLDHILATEHFGTVVSGSGDARRTMPNEMEGSDHTHVTSLLIMKV